MKSVRSIELSRGFALFILGGQRKWSKQSHTLSIKH